MKGVAFFIGLLMLAGLSFSLTTVSSCGILNVSGETYTLDTNLSGAPVDASPLGGNACVKITSSNVIFDCNGFNISDNGTSGTTYGILLNGSLTNVTVRNCPGVSNYKYGIYSLSSNSSVFSNNSAYLNSQAGFVLNMGFFNRLENNSAFSNTRYGFSLLSSSNNTLANNSAYNISDPDVSNPGSCYELSSSSGTILTNNTAYNSSIGFYLRSSSNNNLSANLARNNSNTGILLSASNDNSLTNNTVYGNPVGFSLSSGQRNNLSNDNAYLNLYGFQISDTNDTLFNESASFSSIGISIYSANNTMSMSRSFSNSYAGFSINSGSGTRLSDSLAYNNSVYGFYLYSATNNNLTNDTTYMNSQGFSVGESRVNSLINCTVFNNSYAGTTIFNSNDTRVQGGHYYSNGNDMRIYDAGSGSVFNLSLIGVILDNPPGDMQYYTNISLNDTVPAGQSYAITWAGVPALPPAGRSSFRAKFVNISNDSVGVSIDRIVLHWADSELGGYNESRFELWKRNGTWARLNNTPDTPANELSLANHNPGSTYGILQLNDTTQPTVTSSSPADGFLSNNTSLNFSFNATDDAAVTMNCSFYLDSLLNQTNSSTLNNTPTTFTVLGIPQGLHTWYVACSDEANNTGNSTPRNLTIDTSAPSISLNLPPDSATLYSTSSAFNFTATDNIVPALNCTIYLDGSPNQTNASVLNNILTNFQISGMGAGAHTWRVGCSDGVNINTSLTRSVFVDIQEPSINLNAPNQSAALNSSTVAFNFTATDNYAPILDCSIYVDLVLRDSSSSVISGSPFVFTISGIGDGNHTWLINCSDGGNTNVSATRNFNVTTAVPQPPQEDDDEDRPLTLSAGTSCNGTIVSVKSYGSAVSNVEIRVDGSLVGKTNSSGQETFDGCGKTVEVRASRAGYSTATETISLIDCDSCEVKPPKPPENVTCDCGEVIDGTCAPFGCCSDASCRSNERCDIPIGKTGGQCKPIEGQCGEAINHTFVPYSYECGDEPGCPSCPQDERCQAHVCLSNDLKGPQTGFVGQNSTVQALEGGAPCALCDVVVTDPLGNNLTGKTKPDGSFTLPLTLKGAYSIALLRDGAVVKTLVINALPKTEPIEPPKPPIVQTEDWSWLCWSLILLALIIFGLIYWRHRKKAEGHIAGAPSAPGSGGKTAGIKKR
ncbi:MAG: NosD domain-containing protein [Candidatus Micrarchaeota archaeon]